MIVLLGSSYTRGAWGKDIGDVSAMRHTMLSESLGCDVVNMGSPGNGSERFQYDYVYACKRFSPKLFMVELVEDRSLRWLMVPNDLTLQISGEHPQSIYEKQFQYGLPNQPYVTNDMDYYRIYNSEEVDENFYQGIMQGSLIQGFTLKQILRSLNDVRLFYEHKSLWMMRSIKNFVALEELSSLVGIPILYYKQTDYSNIEDGLKSLIGDRYMNAWCGLNTTVERWADQRMGGLHLADEVHLNKEADRLVIEELMVPFIRHHLSRLDKVSSGSML